MKDNSSKLHTVYIVIIAILLLVIGGGFYYTYNHKNSNNENLIKNQGKPRTGVDKKSGGMKGITAATPPNSDQQKEQLATGTSSATTKKTFNITGGNFYFVPNKITVNKGDEVTFVMTNIVGVHNLIIDELDVKTPTITTGNTTTVTFNASKTGSFVYYCGVPGHRTKGMWGTLVIQ